MSDLHEELKDNLWELHCSYGDEGKRCLDQSDFDAALDDYRDATRARAALEAAPALAVGAPTVKDVHDLCEEFGFRLDGWDEEGIEESAQGLLEIVQAVLARYGPTPVWVAVSERPWEREGWCDDDGRCWWGRRADDFCNHDWHYATRAEVEEFCADAMPQVSLPFHALPLPEGAP